MAYKIIKSQDIEEYILDIKTLESWLWDAARSIRGLVEAPKKKCVGSDTKIDIVNYDINYRMGRRTAAMRLTS